MSLVSRPLRSLAGLIFVAATSAQILAANIVTVTVPVCITPYSFLANTTQTLSATPSRSGSTSPASAVNAGVSSVVVSSFCGQYYIASGQPYYVSCNSSLTGRIIQSSTAGKRKRAVDPEPNGSQFTMCLDLCEGEAACEAIGVSKAACTLYADVQQAAAAVGVVAAYNVRRFAGYVASNGSVTGYLPGQTRTTSSSLSAATASSPLATVSTSASSAFWHTLSSGASISSLTQEPSYTSTTFGYDPSAESTTSSYAMSSLGSTLNQVSSYTPTTFGYSPPTGSTSTASPSTPVTNPTSRSSAAQWSPGSFTLSMTSTPSLSATSISSNRGPSSAPTSSSSNPQSAEPTSLSTSSVVKQQVSSTPSAPSPSSSTSSSIMSSSSIASSSPTSTTIPDCDDVAFIAAPTVCTDPFNNTWTLSNGKTYLGNFVSSSNDSPDIDSCLEKCDEYAGCVAVNWQSQSYANCILLTQVYGSQTPSGGSGASRAQRVAGYSSINTSPPVSTATS